MYCIFSRNAIYFESLFSKHPFSMNSYTKYLYAGYVRRRKNPLRIVLSSIRFQDLNGNMGVIKCALQVRIPLNFLTFLLLLARESISGFFNIIYIVSFVADILMCESIKWKSVFYLSTTTPRVIISIFSFTSIKNLDMFYFFLWALHAWIQIQCALNPKQIHL